MGTGAKRSFRKKDPLPTFRGSMGNKIDYIEGNQNYGIKYDWKAIRKEFAKLGVPAIYHTPMEVPLEKFKYFVEYSARSIGKTTNWLLLGMVMNQMYGTVIQYMRESETQVAPKITKDMFNAIQYNGYIPKVTNGRWNSVYYNSRRWYFCNIDPVTGEMTEVANEHFCMMLVVANSYMYKSGYNAPTGDLIIFDEFINDHQYYPDEFVLFCDLVKTIIRDRRSPIIAMLSNNTNKESQYFNELEIYETVRSMQPNDERTAITEQGTAIYIKYVAPDEQKKDIMTRLNKLYFGFKNKRLGAITGADWAIKPRQHIPKQTAYPIIRNLYVYNNGRYVRIDVVMNEELGICGYCHWATMTYPDSYILTTEDRTDNRYRYGWGSYKTQRLLNNLFSENRMYYATDDIASFLSNYFKNIDSTY